MDGDFFCISSNKLLASSPRGNYIEIKPHGVALTGGVGMSKQLCAKLVAAADGGELKFSHAVMARNAASVIGGLMQEKADLLDAMQARRINADAELQAIGLQLKQAIKERDELAAKAGVLRIGLEFYAEGKFWREGMACTGSHIHLTDSGEVAAQAMKISPVDCLARRDALMKAEAIDNLFGDGDAFDMPASTILELIEESAAEYRKQAEGEA